MTSKNTVFFFRSELAERESMLRTKAMREREEMKERRKYRFALIRIRFPDGLVLQVKSGSTEKFEARGQKPQNFDINLKSSALPKKDQQKVTGKNCGNLN